MSKQIRSLAMGLFLAGMICVPGSANAGAGATQNVSPEGALKASAPAPQLVSAAPFCDEAIIACFDRKITAACYYYFAFCSAN